MLSYLTIVQHILDNGVTKEDRTGTGTRAVAGAMFEHDMSTGFPLLTTKKMPFQMIATELEFFIKGYTDKQWLRERNCHIWDEWCNPKKVPYGHDEETKQNMASERDLGAIYGFQWRHFNAPYDNWDSNYENKGVDQLTQLIDLLKKDPSSRRMVVSAWNPQQQNEMALPPCHWAFQVTVLDGKLNLLWNQRSVDVMLGLPFNIASYALLLHLLAKEGGLKEGRLIGFLGDVHIYSNHIEGAKEQLTRDPSTYPLCRVETEHFTSIFDWTAGDTKKKGYESYNRISFPIAV
ncbi:MAG: thymidylate synthase [Candidatus Magasanikbacteria bacterium CG11_big_fil_rev_8_21_14_0_20_43_7]|uniref:Thymidylate synthase n=1 Tax=Candidatus Magasanikbacteria bacterium CG11_big_fil_rev_8_21_14_0_20_43_7 TaxID=1974654 RepID=A0A2H0N3D9_9BACT|nr:MAG: thymidylate synthase [Candidatus Magasanikbacteria bacterium CG11_big_fil_rev_8_21_14_0_20_43_7]